MRIDENLICVAQGELKGLPGDVWMTFSSSVDFRGENYPRLLDVQPPLADDRMFMLERVDSCSRSATYKQVAGSTRIVVFQKA